MLAFIFVKALITYADPAETETGTGFLGIGVPVAIGVGLILLGVVVMVFANVRLSEVLQAQAGSRRSGNPRGHRGRQGLGAGRLSRR